MNVFLAVSSSDLSQILEIVKGDNQLSAFHLNAQSLKIEFEYVHLFLTNLNLNLIYFVLVKLGLLPITIALLLPATIAYQ